MGALSLKNKEHITFSFLLYLVSYSGGRFISQKLGVGFLLFNNIESLVPVGALSPKNRLIIKMRTKLFRSCSGGSFISQKQILPTKSCLSFSSLVPVGALSLKYSRSVVIGPTPN